MGAEQVRAQLKQAYALSRYLRSTAVGLTARSDSFEVNMTHNPNQERDPLQMALHEATRHGASRDDLSRLREHFRKGLC